MLISLFLALALITPHTQSPAPSTTITANRGLAIAGVARVSRSVILIDGVAARLMHGDFHPKAGDTIAISPEIQSKPAPAKIAGHAVWTEVNADANGLFNLASFANGYLQLTFESPTDQIMILESTGAAMVYCNAPHMGDLYSLGYQRIPLAIKKGANEMFFAGDRGPIKARLVAPRILGAQIDINDLTAPDLVLGEPLDSWIGIRIINASNTDATNLALEIESQDGATTRTPVSDILALGVVKTAARIRSGPFGLIGPARFRVALVRADSKEGDHAGALDETNIELAVVAAATTRKETFLSAIDSSAQYFAVVPALQPSADASASTITTSPQPGLLLTLHGAGVEALGQARCYAPRDWAYIVAPTNRRPYGFAWEDWGRLDAIEVLNTARQRFHTDHQRQWLTGHSMGGHGTWQIGAHFSNFFAAIAPSAGWISFFTYVNTPIASTGPNDFIGNILDRANNPSRTLLLKENYSTQGVFVLHGDADETVPVAEAREMRTQLGAFHPDFVYHEQAGAGHWWGNACVDNPPLMDFLHQRKLPNPESRNHISFTTLSPSIHATNGWITIDAQITALDPSSANLTIDRAARTIRGTTTNAARLALQADIDGDAALLTLQIDDTTLTTTEPDGGDRIWLTRTTSPNGSPGAWNLSASPPTTLKSAARMGPFKSAFTNRPVLVYGTAGTDAQTNALRAKARFDNEQFLYRGNASFEIVDDQTFLTHAADRFINRNIIIYGNSNTNRAWSSLLADSPITVRQHAIDVTASNGTKTTITGDDLAALFVRPRPHSTNALVGVVAATGSTGQFFADLAPYFVAGASYPDLSIFRANTFENGPIGAVAAAFFANDWTLSPTDVLLWRISQ